MAVSALPTSNFHQVRGTLRKQRRQALGGGGGGFTTITTDEDGDPETVFLSPTMTRTDADGDPSSTRFRTMSTLSSSRSSRLTDADGDPIQCMC